MKFGMFMMGEYIEIVATNCLLTVIFFGGYDVPFLHADGLHWPGGGYTSLTHLTVTILNVLNFMIKVVVLCWLNLMIRWSLPRFRYDQIMSLCWRYMLPLSLANIFVTGMWILLSGG
jgi:NADH-quinone oxidoreductase subunit H